MQPMDAPVTRTPPTFAPPTFAPPTFAVPAVATPLAGAIGRLRRAALVLLASLLLLGGATGGALADYTVVLDPGHGGRDGGAVGRGGTREKVVTLAFARAMAEHLRAAGVRVHLTRDGDRSLRLADRVAAAREHRADLFVSLHADSIRHRKLRGASVYTLSDEASDEVAASLAEGEGRSDVLAGFSGEMGDDQGVADILIDLMRRETETFSTAFAKHAVRSLGQSTRMIRNPHRSANFRVLRAPDVPSVLVELGYLSNRKDERQLADPEWRDRIARALADAIVTHARGTGAELAGGSG